MSLLGRWKLMAATARQADAFTLTSITDRSSTKTFSTSCSWSSVRLSAAQEDATKDRTKKTHGYHMRFYKFLPICCWKFEKKFLSSIPFLNLLFWAILERHFTVVHWIWGTFGVRTNSISLVSPPLWWINRTESLSLIQLASTCKASACRSLKSCNKKII